MWWWRKVRRANISQDLRDELERIGETVIIGGLVLAPDMPSSFLHTFVTQHREGALAWLTERRDIETRHEDRVETVEWAILVFVIFGVLIDVLLLIHERT